MKHLERKVENYSSEKSICRKLFFSFLKIGFFTIGGGYAMIPLIEAEIIEKHKWIEKEDFLSLMAIAQSTPGIFAINISIFIGYKLRKLRGSLCSTLGCVLPSFVIILLIALFFTHFKDYPVVERIFKGVRPAVVALIAAPVFKMAKTVNINWQNFWIPVLAAVLIWLCGVSPVYVIIVAGVSGFVYGKFFTAKS